MSLAATRKPAHDERVHPRLILAVLSLAVWAGLHFYNRSVTPRTNQRVAPGQLPSATQTRRSVQMQGKIRMLEGGAHEFTV